MIRAGRLLLRAWRDDDLPAFAAMNADPCVRAYFGGPLDRAASDASAARIRAHFDRHGWGFWAVELPGDAPFAGFVGLCHVAPDLPFAPAVEIGWRLARRFWGRGLATEAARAALDHGFGVLRLGEIVSFAVADNRRSRAVMERVGMSLAGTFDHPGYPHGHPLCLHVLYGLAAPAVLPPRGGSAMFGGDPGEPYRP